MIRFKPKLPNINKNGGLRQKMESLNLIHGLVFIASVCLIIVSVSISMYLKSDRSKYDLYRPGRSKPVQQTVESNVSVDKNQEVPVYKEDIDQVILETSSVVESEKGKPAFNPQTLEDANLIKPELNLNP